MLTTIAIRPLQVVAKHKVPKMKRTPVKQKDLMNAIEQAKQICYNFEDTIECRMAFDRVEELSSELARQRDEMRRIVDDIEFFSEIETREYDL